MKKYIGLLSSLIISNTIGFGQLWTVRYNGTGNGEDANKSMVTDNTGNVYVTGSAYSGSGNYDYLTVKFNNSGVQQWQAKYNGPSNGTTRPVLFPSIMPEMCM